VTVALVSLFRAVSLVASLRSGQATTFAAHGDPGNPNARAACLHRDLDDIRDLVVASRDIPCRSQLLVCVSRTGICSRAIVGDRGPYGRKRNGQFRAELDLAPALRKKLKHSGREAVFWLELDAR
jgi:hypothetical protein